MLQEIGWVVAEGVRLSEWEKKFVHSMHRCQVADSELSEKQHAALARVWERVYKKDVDAPYL